jgi:hypothetical protein
MKALEIKKIEGCLDGTNVRDILWDNPVDKLFIDYLALGNKLIYQKGAGKPFYKIIVRGKYSLKGSEGANSSRVVLPSKDADQYLQELIDFAEKYIPN